jgi:membrane protein
VVSPSEVADDLGALARAAPSSLGAAITEQLQRVASADRAGVSIGLVISFALAVWSASAGVYNLDRAIRDAFELPHQGYVEARGRAVAAAFAVVVLLGSLALGGAVLGAHTSAVALALVGAPLGLVALTLGIAGLYRLSVGPTVRWRQLLPGAAAAAVAVVVALVAFAVYVGLSKRFTAVYGAFAGVVIGMIGLYLAAYAILLGAVLDAQLAKR